MQKFLVASAVALAVSCAPALHMMLKNPLSVSFRGGRRGDRRVPPRRDRKAFVFSARFLSRVRGIGMTPSGNVFQHPVEASDPVDTETRVLHYIRDHLQQGRPLLVSELYSKVFTQPDERQALGKLYNAFFRIPLFLAERQEKFGSPPRLAEIAQQFDLHSPEAADILLRVMEADPRVPHFLTRDPTTHEIRHVDIAAIRADPQFGEALSRQLSGWEGQKAPDITLPALDGGQVTLAGLLGKVVLLEIWFTGCPPCLRETPELVKLQSAESGRGFTVVAANADKVLSLSYDDAVRRRYADEQGINFPIADWTPESDKSYGKISIFPTLFLIGRKGVVIRHWVGYVPGGELRRAVEDSLSDGQPIQ